MSVTGSVVAVFTGPEEDGPVKQVSSVEAIAGRGIQGDRYFREGDAEGDPTEEITLFESEAIIETNETTDLDVQPEDMRRNILTSGLSLVELIGKRLKIGDAVVEPMEDNPPCKHLVELAGKDLLKPLIKKGGVRGRILTSGTIREGDTIEVLQD